MMAPRPGVDVVVPVFRGLAQTRACIESVLDAGLGDDDRLVVIDDASPEAELSDYVAALAGRAGVAVLANERNLGFVATVNRGMRLSPQRDVVLLNSDTRVANDWLARLQACAYACGHTATATPFSNSATVCSYPYEGWPGGVPGTLGLAALDRLFAATLRGESCELPTAIGFCMYIRRDALDEIGLFDEERFGRGYGEENDFCMRAAERGWRHRLAADVFVFHEGSVSFGAERTALQQTAHRVLLERHPDYLQRIETFIALDPLAGFRDRIDRARSALGAREEATVLQQRGQLPAGFEWSEPTLPPPDSRPVQLHIAHGWGGGISRWLDDFHAADGEYRNLVLQSVSHRNAAGFRLELREPGRAEALASRDLQLPIRACSFEHPEYRAFLQQVIALCGARRLFVSSLIGHSLEALDSGLPTALVLHDLFPFCPALFGHFRGACTRCGRAELDACLAGNPFNVFWHNTSAEDWLRLRERLADRIRQGALRLVAPSRSVVERWHALLPEVSLQATAIIPHGIDVGLLGPRAQPPADGGRRLRLVVPGRLAPHKGLDILAEAMPELGRSAELLLLGCGDYGSCFEGREGVRVVPDYAPQQLGALVREFAPDAALLLSAIAESFSYTLSEMQALGLPVIASRGGAFGERIAAGATGHLIEPSAQALLACLRQLSPASLRAMRHHVLAVAPVRREDCVAALNAVLPAGEPPPADRLGLLADSLAGLRLRHDLCARRQIRLEAAVDHEKGTVAMRDAEIAALAERPPQPAAANPRIALLRPDAARICTRLRYWLGVGDRSRLVLHAGEPESSQAAERLIAAAQALVAARNDVMIVVTRSTAEADCWQALRAPVARLRSARRLHFVPRAPEDASWLLGCDLLLTSSEAAAARFAPSADEAGIACWHLDAADAPAPGRCAEILRLLDSLPPTRGRLNL